MLQLGRRGKGEQDARCRCGRESPLPGCVDGVTGTGTTPAAFYLGLCRLRGILSPPSSTTTCRRRAIPQCSSEDAASIPKFGLEIKNRCTQEGVNGEILASIPKSEPEIKNHCSPRAKTRVFSAVIPKFTP